MFLNKLQKLQRWILSQKIFNDKIVSQQVSDILQTMHDDINIRGALIASKKSFLSHAIEIQKYKHPVITSVNDFMQKISTETDIDDVRNKSQEILFLLETYFPDNDKFLIKNTGLSGEDFSYNREI